MSAGFGHSVIVESEAYESRASRRSRGRGCRRRRCRAARRTSRRRARRRRRPSPAVQIDTVDILVAKADIGIGQAIAAQDMQWQMWPTQAASPAFIRKTDKPDAIEQLTGAIARAPFVAGEPMREAKLIKANGSGYMAARARQGHARDLDRNLAGNRRRRLHPAERPRRRDPVAARPRGREGGAAPRSHISDTILTQHPRSRDRPDARREGRAEGRDRQDRDARAHAAPGRDARAVAPARHAVAGAAQPRGCQANARLPNDDRATASAARHQHGALRRHHRDHAEMSSSGDE